MTNEPLTPTTSNSLNAFVNSVADMEIRHYTLLETAKKIKDDVKKRNAQSKDKLKNAKCELERRLIDKEESQKNIDKKDSRITYFLGSKEGRGILWEVLGELVGFTIVGAIVAYLLSMLLGIPFSDNIDTIIFVSILIVIFIGILTFLVDVYKSAYPDHLKEIKDSFDKATESYEQAQQELTLAQESYDEAQKDILLLNKKAEELENSAVIVRNNLTKCYELGVIPPSYRNMICVILINDIFMNNKADSMRDAILLCDIEIRHAEIVNKLNDINHSLQTLATSIQSMNSLLCDINYNINLISSDISVLNQQQERIAYATESIQRSAENADFYIAQRRVGSL